MNAKATKQAARVADDAAESRRQYAEDRKPGESYEAWIRRMDAEWGAEAVDAQLCW